MSQKIIIPKGTIDSAHTTIIEIPNYLHETSTVVVTTPKTADSSIEQSWEANEDYFEGVEQNETDWGQDYDAQEVNDAQEINDEEYASDQQDQYTGNQYAISEDPESGNEAQQLTDQDETYVDYVEEAPPQPTQPPRRSKFDVYAEPMRRRILDKKRELLKMHAERQKIRDGEIGIYDATPDTDHVEDALRLMSEVPREMRARSATREKNFEKEKKRRMQEFERNQACSAQVHPGYQTGYHMRDQICSSMKSQQYAHLQPAKPWNQGHPNMQYVRQGQPTMQTPATPQRRQMAGQVGFVAREEARHQYQKPRRKPVFHIPKN